MKQCIKCFHCADGRPENAIHIALWEAGPHPLSCDVEKEKSERAWRRQR